MAKAAIVGSLDQSLESLQNEFSDMVSNVRGRGLFAAFDLATPEMRGEVLNAIWANGAIILPCGWKSIRFRPSLTINEAEVEKAGEIIRKSLAEVKK